jgi:predicted transport protein
MEKPTSLGWLFCFPSRTKPKRRYLSNAYVCMSLISKQDPHVFLTLKLDPATVDLEKGFARDVSNIGHWGTGDLELVLRTSADFIKAKVLIERAYQEN